MKVYVKPPIGLTPRHIRESQRLSEIFEAMYRYSEVNKPIPVEWLEEYNELAERLGRR